MKTQTWYTRDGREVVNKLLNAPTCIDSGILTVFYFRLSWQKYKPCLKAWDRQIKKKKMLLGPPCKQFGYDPFVVLKPYGHISSVTELC